MVSDFGWAVNGSPLATAFGDLFLTDATLWRPSVEIRRSPVVIPGVHGTVNPSLPVYGEPTVGLTLRSRQASQAALEEAVNQAVAILTAPSLTLTRTSGTSVTTAVAQLVSLDPGDSFIYGQAARIVAVFAIPGVFFRTTAWTSDDIAAAGDLTNQELSGLSGSTGPIVDPVFRLAGPWTNPYLSDPSTGTGIYYSGTVAAGSFLYLCPKPLSARIATSSSAWSSGGTDVSAAVSYPAAGRLQLWPVVQTATTRKVLISTTGTSRVAGQTKLAVQARGSYL
jgi:hypothetical protein